MTITYPSGTVLKAIALSHGENEIRAVAAGGDDVLECTRVHDAWIPEEMETVTIEFARQRRQRSPSISEDDCLCSKELATHLIAMVISGCERGEAGEDIIYVFSAECSQVAIQRTALYDRQGLRQERPRVDWAPRVFTLPYFAILNLELLIGGPVECDSSPRAQ